MNCYSKFTGGNLILIEHAAGRLEGRRAEAVSAHLSHCDACRRFSQSQKGIWDLLDNLEQPPVSADFNRQLYARLEADRRSVFAKLNDFLQVWTFRPAMPMAALALLVLAGVYLERPRVTAPVAAPVALPALVSPTDGDQINSALDDLQLLHQLDVVKDDAADASHHM